MVHAVLGGRRKVRVGLGPRRRLQLQLLGAGGRCRGVLVLLAAAPTPEAAPPAEPAREAPGEVGQLARPVAPQGEGGRRLEEVPHWRERRRLAQAARVAAEPRGAARVAVQLQEVLEPQRRRRPTRASHRRDCVCLDRRALHACRFLGP